MNTAHLGGRPRPSATPKKTAVFIDGSALFLGVRSVASLDAQPQDRPRLNYRAMRDLLIERVPELKPPSSDHRGPSPWTMWTSVAPDNPGQKTFLDFAANQLHFDVRQFPPSHAFMIEPTEVFGLGDSTKSGRLIRFDSAISFAMGRICDRYRIVLVSDSFAYAEALSRINEYWGAEVGRPVLAFFGRVLDSRWHAVLRSDHGPEFINFDDYEPELFGVERKEVVRSAATDHALKF